jgi:cardiolipin synthase A/B
VNPEVVLSAVWFWAGVLLTVLDLAIVLVLVPRIVLDRRESGATLAWVVLIIAFPLVGLLAFWVLGTTRLRMRRKRRRKAETAMSGKTSPLVVAAAMALEPNEKAPVAPEMTDLVRRLDGVGPIAGNAVTLFREGPGVFDAIEQAVNEAKDHVHVEYYIWEPDRLGHRMRDVMAAAARRGVAVRLLVDDVGAMKAKPKFFAPIEEAGGRVRRFLPVSLFTRRLDLNNRNHRKIVVVDGKVGFTGGMNVGEEYLGIDKPWRDAHVRVEGPAVARLQELFAQDWYHTVAEDLGQARYFPITGRRGDVWCQFVGSGPDDQGWYSIATLLFASIGLSRDRVWIQTPYFVPDPPMTVALCTAALRGVDVRLLLSSALDHPAVLYAARSHYAELLAAGVKIWELPIMQHNKTVTIDGKLSTVGSTNFDRRSFRLNFEANAFFYGPPLALEIEKMFEDTQREARRITPEGFARRSRMRKAFEAMARVMAPIM